MYASEPNGFLLFDFLSVAEGQDEYKCILVFVYKDDFTSYTWLRDAQLREAAASAEAVLAWLAPYAPVQNWTSGEDTYLQNAVPESFAHRLNGEHSFTPACSPQSNGTVEVVCREVLRGNTSAPTGASTWTCFVAKVEANRAAHSEPRAIT